MNHDNHDMMGQMDHGNMDHGNIDHGSMDHANMDHSNMDHMTHIEPAVTVDLPGRGNGMNLFRYYGAELAYIS